VPWTRVEETAEQFTAMGAAVTLRRYPKRPHTVLPEEVAQASALLASVLTKF
jgi:predicted esterase